MGQFLWLLATFVLGTIAVGVVWIAPPEWLGSYGHFAGWIAAAGVGLAIVSGLFKFMREGTAAGRFDACHRQLDLVLSQIDEAERERKRLDRELPLMEGSAALRLEHAERHLAELERVLPIEGQRHEAAREIAAAERRLALAEEKCAAARKNWQAKLRALGLPDDVSPANLATMAGQCERLAELETRIENRRDDLGRREREFEAVSQRIFDLADESGVPGAGSNRAPDQAASSMPAQTRQAKAQAPRPEPATVRPAMRALEQLDRLVAEFRQQQQRVTHRQELRARAKELKAEELRHARAAIGFSRRRTALFQKCGVADEHELRQLAAKLNEAEELRKRRADVTRQIGAAIGKHGAEQDYAPLLALETIGRLESDWEALAAKRDALDRGLVELLQKRGALVEQQRAQAADRSLAVKQVELDCVDVQIKRATTAWRERAAVSLFLERIREDYEQHRQPETLQEASGYLRKLTSGRYTRIWTPLANDILFVDTPDGQALPVQVLSRGTREQLFVSLRLALVATFARRGIHLPLILDDVFVNFDAERTRIAADVLRDFAKQGHQLLVFTCHEHVWQIFQELKVDTRRLPSRFGDLEEGPATESPEPAATVVAKLSEPSSPQAILNPAPEMAEQPDAPYVEPLGIEIEEPAPTDAEEAEVDVEYAALAPSATPSPVEVEYWWPTMAGTR
jgi:uncharacterized protein YhaN